MLRATIDTDEWDEMFGRVSRGLREGLINLIAARSIAGTIRDTYDERWDRAMPEGTTEKYTAWKEWLGAGNIPGTLTGSSKRAITAEADDRMGRVFLAGNWPNLPQTEALEEDEGLRQEPGSSSHGGPLFYDETGVPTDTKLQEAARFNKAYANWFIDSQPFSSMTYGADRRTGGPFTWFFATPADTQAAVEIIDELTQFLLTPTRRLATGRLMDIFEILPNAEAVLDVGRSTRSPLDILLEQEEEEGSR